MEEFNNQKTQPPAGSPLHCPFPSLHQPHAAPDSGTVQNIAPIPFSPSTNSAGVPSVPPALEKQRNNNNLSFSAGELSFPPILNTTGKLHRAPGNLFPESPNAEGDNEFSDFKSAALNTSSDRPDPNEVSLIKEEDKYDALRAFSMQSDEVVQPSAFSEAFKTDDSTENAMQVEAGEEDDWADFTTAPLELEVPTANDAQAPAIPASGPAKASKEDILTLFSKTEAIQPSGSLFSSGSSNSARDLSNDNGWFSVLFLLVFYISAEITEVGLCPIK